MCQVALDISPDDEYNRTHPRDLMPSSSCRQWRPVSGTVGMGGMRLYLLPSITACLGYDDLSAQPRHGELARCPLTTHMRQFLWLAPLRRLRIRCRPETVLSQLHQSCKCTHAAVTAPSCSSTAARDSLVGVVGTTTCEAATCEHEVNRKTIRK